MTTTDVGVLDKVMAILGLFDDQVSVIEPSRAARDTGMSTPTAYRLMKAMAAHGLLVPRDKGYGLGLSLLHLGTLAAEHLDLVATARPHMARLRDACNETVELQILRGSTRVPVHFEISTRTVRLAPQAGVPLPVHKGASAYPLLAWLPEEEALRLARESADREGDALDETRFLAKLRQVHEQGYTLSAGERDPETGAAAAPIFDRSGHPAGVLVVSGTRTRFEDEEHAGHVRQALLPAARAVTEDLGGPQQP